MSHHQDSKIRIEFLMNESNGVTVLLFNINEQVSPNFTKKLSCATISRKNAA
jgi:hypothetical protein